MKLYDLIKEQDIVFDVQGSTKEDIILELSKALYNNQNITNIQEFYNSVLEREKHSTTGFGGKIAIPHGKSSVVKNTTVIIGKTKVDIDWNSMDGQKVDTVFLLAISGDNNQNSHLEVLAELAGSLMDEEFLNCLRNAKNQKELLEVIKQNGGQEHGS